MMLDPAPRMLNGSTRRLGCPNDRDVVGGLARNHLGGRLRPVGEHDLERWLNRLVPERDPLYTHTTEGDDDMPAHVKAALTTTSLSIPIENGKLVWLDEVNGQPVTLHDEPPSSTSKRFIAWLFRILPMDSQL